MMRGTDIGSQWIGWSIGSGALRRGSFGGFCAAAGAAAAEAVVAGAVAAGPLVAGAAVVVAASSPLMLLR
jgi:hypothetical protein